MKIRVTGYSHTYPLGASGQFEKAWIEADFEENDDIQTSLQFLKQQVEQFHKESNPGALTVTSVKVVEEKKSVEEKTIEQINEITDIKVLKEFSLLANNMATKYPRVKSAYDNRLKQLTA
jgi:hypothetical protein